jgi:hypothetical protein
LLINQRANICRHWTVVFIWKDHAFSITHWLLLMIPQYSFRVIWKETDLKRSFFVHAIFESAWSTHHPMAAAFHKIFSSTEIVEQRKNAYMPGWFTRRYISSLGIIPRLYTGISDYLCSSFVPKTLTRHWPTAFRINSFNVYDGHKGASQNNLQANEESFFCHFCTVDGLWGTPGRNPPQNVIFVRILSAKDAI